MFRHVPDSCAITTSENEGVKIKGPGENRGLFVALFCVVQVFYMLVAIMSKQVVEQHNSGVIFRNGPDSGGDCRVTASYSG